MKNSTQTSLRPMTVPILSWWALPKPSNCARIKKNAVWRAIQEGTACSDHVVGAGKTLACVAASYGIKRMGFLSKPMIVVPNHLLYQWKDEFYKLYPDANILVADKTDFTKQNRERLFGRIATGDWDAVIVAHSSFKNRHARDVQEEILKEQIDAVIEAIEASKAAEGGRPPSSSLRNSARKWRNVTMPCLRGTGKKTGPWILRIWAWMPCLSTKATSSRIWPSRPP